MQGLGSEKFSERELAQRLLEQQIKTPWEESLVLWMRKDRKDAEISRRVQSITERWDCTMTDYGKYPWLDALPQSYPCRDKIVSGYLEKVGVVFPDEDYARYRIATMMWLEDMRKGGCRMHMLWGVQRTMIPNEEFWIKNRKYP